MKADSTVDGRVALFRPEDNAARYRGSARRLAMPELPEELFIESLWTLIEHDRAWVPTHEGDTLYLRPFMFGTDPFLGVRPSNEYLHVVIASPSRAYFAGGGRPITVLVARDFVRAAPGGTGGVKTAANYAGSLAAYKLAQANGCDQVVFLDAVEKRWVEEAGTMNMFFVYKNEVVTPPLTGTILPGITRDSVLRIAESLGRKAVERPVSIEQWRADAENGSLREVFASGTGVVITSIGSVRDGSETFTIGGGSNPAEPGPLTRQISTTLMDIQFGRVADPYNWIRTRP
jgi:branched-chain amino acid aminotransferase